MDLTALLISALIAIVYFLVYRLFVYKKLKWKMIHSIWLPILYAIGFTGFGLSLLSTPWFGANRTTLSVIQVLVELNLPVIIFFVLYFTTAFLDQKKVKA